MYRLVFVALGLISSLAYSVVPGTQSSVAYAAPAHAVGVLTNPLPPVPLAPLDKDTVFAIRPTLRVESGGQFHLYHFRVMEGSSTAAEGYSPIPEWFVIGEGGRALQRGHDYQWSCCVLGDSGWSEWFSPEWGFSVGSLVPTPQLKSPADGASVPALRPFFIVRAVGIGATYHFQVWNGKTLVGEGASLLPVWRYRGGSGGLEPGVVYQWTCRVESESDTSAWFAPAWSFEVNGDQQRGEVQAGGSVEGMPRVSAEPGMFRSSVAFAAEGCLLRSVEVYAVDGRRVRTLGSGPRPVWNGRDAAGRRVPQGTYICVADGEWGRQILKVTKVE